MKTNRLLNCRTNQENSNKHYPTFRQLIDKQHSHQIKVSCKNKVNVLMQKMVPTNNRFLNKKDPKISIKPGQGTTLNSIFKAYQEGQYNEELVLVLRKSQLLKQKYSSRGKSLSNKSQTSIKACQNLHFHTNKYQINVFSQENLSQRKRLHSYFSQKIIKNQLKEYLSQQPSKQKPKQNKVLFNEELNEANSKLEQQIHQNKNINMLNQTFQPIPNAKSETFLPNIQQKIVNNPVNPKFSFGSIIKFGLIQHQSLNNRQSFKIVGDDSIQQIKRTTVQSPNDMKSFEDLSSIISNVKDDNKKDLQVDSIKKQLQKINNCCIPKDKVYYKKIKTQNIGDENCMYGNKEQKPLVPLKFRKKEEVVKHLVNAKIISKQSSSINIS